MTLRMDAASPSTGMHLGRLEELLAFLRPRMSEADYTEAESLLHAAIEPAHAARRPDFGLTMILLLSLLEYVPP